MKINWIIIIIVAICAGALLSYLIIQNLKDKKGADKDFNSVDNKERQEYETNDEEI